MDPPHNCGGVSGTYCMLDRTCMYGSRISINKFYHNSVRKMNSRWVWRARQACKIVRPVVLASKTGLKARQEVAQVNKVGRRSRQNVILATKTGLEGRQNVVLVSK